VDVILVGAGVSSVMLAQCLIREGAFRSLRIIATTTRIAAHRLSYWSEEPLPFDAFGDAAFAAIRVVSAQGEVVALPLHRLTYHTFAARRWHAAALEEVLRHPGVDLVERRAETVESSGARAVVNTGDDRLEADWVFSSAPLERAPSVGCQRFEGWEIELADGRLDAGTATWLDFRTQDHGAFEFMYTLPLGPRRLFVEHVSSRPGAHASQIERYLEAVLGLSSWTVLDRERGSTPLYAGTYPRIEGRVVAIGVAGGLAKASTGFALTRMWRDANAIARSLRERGRPELPPGSGPLYRMADRVFLELEPRPEMLREFLLELCRNATGDALLAFLDEQASLKEQLQIARAAPRWLRSLRSAARGGSRRNDDR
jgi:lycopene beta-cyclase